MARHSRFLVLIALASLLTSGGCGGDDDGPSNPGGGGGGGGNSFTAVIDGVNWTSDEAAISVTGISTPTREGMLILTGFEASRRSRPLDGVLLLHRPGFATAGRQHGHDARGLGTVMENVESWTTPMSGQAGFITLSARTATRVAGTFNYTAEAQGGAVPATRVVTGGAFDYTRDTGRRRCRQASAARPSPRSAARPGSAATIVGLNGGGGVFSLAAGNTAYSITLVPPSNR
ncbi:MAG: hypothetical protein IPP62_16145 [bacterium]|nr:hypothetical protein [bacterium]